MVRGPRAAAAAGGGRAAPLLRQPTLRAWLAPAAAPLEVAPLEVYDLFAGIGGFSTGAALAGCRVAFACDADAEALRAHAANHPGCAHLRASLPCALPLPVDGRRWHLHASPPCQSFCAANQARAAARGLAAERERVVGLARWCVRLAAESTAESWSFEEVPSPLLLAMLEEERRRRPDRVAYARLNCRHLGVAQNRVRLFAGTPAVVARLLRARESVPHRAVRDVLVPARGTHIRDSRHWVGKKRKRARPSATGATYAYERAGRFDNIHPLDGPAPTVLGGRKASWVRVGDARWGSSLTAGECARLQTFPPDSLLPRAVGTARRLVGNALPPRVAALMLRDDPLAPLEGFAPAPVEGHVRVAEA